MQNIYTITQLNTYIKSILDGDNLLQKIQVKGEISNYKKYPSGHHYFSLKDENSLIRCVMFKGYASKLRFNLENGMKIIAIGQVQVYTRDGAYQFYAENLTVDGVGDLYVAFEQLKNKLGSQGLFDARHKKPLPQMPNRVAIITSSAGAAVHDMMRIMKARWPLTEVKVMGVRVQGKEAPAEIVGAIRYANRWKVADVLIVGRGGGSIEDLWAFNDERVAYAIYQSEIPVISAVGHEPDVTISDYVADLRASTPSNAAELVVPDKMEQFARLQYLRGRMNKTLLNRLDNAKKRYNRCANARVMSNPSAMLNEQNLLLDSLTQRLKSSMTNKINIERRQFARLTAGLDAMSPLKVLARGYAVAEQNNSVVNSVEQLDINSKITVRLSDGKLNCNIDEIVRN